MNERFMGSKDTIQTRNSQSFKLSKIRKDRTECCCGQLITKLPNGNASHSKNMAG